MKNGSLRRSLLLSAAVIGCQGCGDSNQQVKTAPGALPSGQFSRADRTHEIHATTYFAHGHLLERQGAFDRALEQYQEALKAKPDFLICRNRLGITLNKLGRHAEATEHFRKAISLRNDLAHLHNNLGFSLYLEAKYEEAERSLARAIELKSGFGRARMNHAITLAKLGKYNEAFAEMRTTTSAANAAFNMGMLLTEAGRYADAAKYLEAALAAKPDFEAARNQLNELSRLAAAEDADLHAARAIDALRVEPATLIPESDETPTASAAAEPTHTVIEPTATIADATTADAGIEPVEGATEITATDASAAEISTAESDSDAAFADAAATNSLATRDAPEYENETSPETLTPAVGESHDSTTEAATNDEIFSPILVMNTASEFDPWHDPAATDQVAVVAGTSVELGTAGWMDEGLELDFDDPNCAPGNSPLDPPARPVIHAEIVSSLIEDFAFTVNWHRELAAEVLCRLETYMQTGQLGKTEDDAAE